MSFVRSGLQACHHVGEEAEVTGVVIHWRMGGVRVTHMAQGSLGPVPKIPKHGSMNALQHPPLQHFLPTLSCDGLGVINPPLKREQLGAGGGQFRLRRDQGGCGGLLAPLHLS